MSDTVPRGTPQVRRADLLLDSYQGVVDRLEALYDERSKIIGPKAVQVLPVSNLDNVEKKLQDVSLNLTLPIIGVAPGSVEPNTNSFNASVMRKYGVSSTISEDRSTWTVLSLVPVLTVFQVMIVTDDFLTLLRMIDRWMSNELWGFTLQHADYKVRIKVYADKSMTVPPRQPDSANSDQFRQTTTLRVETYSGYLWSVPSVYEIDLSLGVTSAAISKLSQLEEVQSFALTKVIDAPSHEPVA